ncbi:MAG: hypothetical protein JRG86_04255, partial [Deltaproteobacteria bacterium]|nr:hypothetical protein [Deltaproteobacteria bacterium]
MESHVLLRLEVRHEEEGVRGQDEEADHAQVLEHPDRAGQAAHGPEVEDQGPEGQDEEEPAVAAAQGLDGEEDGHQDEVPRATVAGVQVHEGQGEGDPLDDGYVDLGEADEAGGTEG